MTRRVRLGVAIAVGIIAAVGLGQAIKNPDTLIYVTYGPEETLDPAFVYDTASGEVLFQIYECLLSWPYGIVDADEVDLSYSLASSDLVPMLATNVPEPLQLGDATYYTFDIRQGVKFHEGGVLTPEDVEYTFERAMLQDRDGGPVWMFLEPLTGFGSLRQVVAHALGREVGDLHTLTPEEQALVYNEYIDPLVEVSGNTVTFKLQDIAGTRDGNPNYPPFLTILAHGAGWSSIVDKEWCIEVGCWDGKPDTWAKWWNPGGGEAAEASELYKIANGTGPFKLVRWDPNIETVFERFDGYWREPAQLKTVVIRKTAEWSDRLLMFQAGDADLCQVDPQYRPQVIGTSGIVYHSPLPALSMNPVAFFTAPVVLEGNQLVGDGPWDGYGIPADFFADVNVRKAFCLAFDYDIYIEEVLLGDGFKTHGPIPSAFEWAYNPDPELLWEFDVAAATELMKQARGGEIWEKGFKLTLVYNEGNDARRVSAEILEANFEAMNPKFQIEVRALPWPTQLSLLVTQKMPLFIIGWLADFPDPHNFAVPFATSYGTFSGWQGDYMVNEIYAPIFDSLVADGMKTADQAERAAIYYEISRLAHEYAIDLWLPQLVGYRFVRDWVQGYPFNPMYPGPYFYPMYKAYE